MGQLLNRRFGSSPLAGALNDVTAQWAYWNHKFEFAGAKGTAKVGRTPLPRGLLNEVRYIGSVLPFFRPSMDSYSDAFDALDGAVLSMRKPIGDFSLEAHGFFGGSDWRSVVTTSTGQDVRVQRMENYYDELNSLPHIEELKSPDDHRQRYRKASQRAMNQAYEEANKNSILQLIATKIPLKGGRSSFSRRDGKIGEKMHLSSFSHSMAFPRAEVIDSVGCAIERFHFQLAKVGDT